MEFFTVSNKSVVSRVEIARKSVSCGIDRQDERW